MPFIFTTQPRDAGHHCARLGDRSSDRPEDRVCTDRKRARLFPCGDELRCFGQLWQISAKSGFDLRHARVVPVAERETVAQCRLQPTSPQLVALVIAHFKDECDLWRQVRVRPAGPAAPAHPRIRHTLGSVLDPPLPSLIRSFPRARRETPLSRLPCDGCQGTL